MFELLQEHFPINSGMPLPFIKAIMWLNINCLCAIYVDWNQQAFLAQVTSFVVWYDVIYHFFPISSQYLMTWGTLGGWQPGCSCTELATSIPKQTVFDTQQLHLKNQQLDGKCADLKLMSAGLPTQRLN